MTLNDADPQDTTPGGTDNTASGRQTTGTAESNGAGNGAATVPRGRQLWEDYSDGQMAAEGRCVECACDIEVQGHAVWCSEPEQPAPPPSPPPETPEAPRGQPPPPMPRVWHGFDMAPPKPTKWLAANRIPRGAVSLLVGDEGIGKSLFWVWIVAAITTGRPLPMFGIPARKPDYVHLVLTEDDWQSTVRPRLEVAGANVGKVRIICTEPDGSGAPVFPRDNHLILNAEPLPVLVVIDAWLDTVGSDLRVRDTQQARQALHPFKDLATKTEAAILLLTHTNRLASANPRDLYGATAALRQKCRMTLFALEDDDRRLVIGPEKANMTRLFPATLFTTQSVEYFEPTPDNDGTIPKLAFHSESDMTVREHVAERNAAAREQSTEALPWLAEFLSSGPQASVTVLQTAARNGFSEKVIRAAKVKLHAEVKKSGNTWFWCLPHHVDRLPGGGDD